MNPFASVQSIVLINGFIRTESGRPFGLRLAALRNEQDPGPIEAVAIYVPKGEIILWDTPQPYNRFNCRSSCVAEPGRPQIRGYFASSQHGSKITDTTAEPIQEPIYDIQNLSPTIVGSRPPAGIPMKRITLGVFGLTTDAVFDSFKVFV